MDKFKNKTIFITGASSGIGKALVQEFFRQGASLILLARRKHRLDQIVANLGDKDQRVVSFQCDVNCLEDLKAAVVQGVNKFGKIDVVVANAGFGVAGTLEKIHVEDYRRQFETNVFGVLNTTYSTLDQLKNTKGTLVLVGSVAGSIALPGNSAYAMSKAAVNALSDSLTGELVKYGVSVVLITPGFIESEIRKVNNQGVYQDHARDPVPHWLVMSSDRAAKKMIQAIYQKKREKVITFHGQLALFLRRFVPGLLQFLVQLGLKGRDEPSE